MTQTMIAFGVMVALSAPVMAQTTKEVKPKPVSAIGGIRTVEANENKVEELTMRAGFSTMLVLPVGVGIVYMALGDRTLWNPEQPMENIVAFKPVTDDIESNLMITTSTGKILPFFLRAVKNQQPDMKVSVNTGDDLPGQAPKYVPASAVEPIKVELTAAYAKIDALQGEVAKALQAAKASVPPSLSYYEVKNVPPFKVQGMVTDGEKTYINFAGREAPVVYEMVDNKPAHVNVQAVNSTTYVVTKVLGPGYLVLGQTRIGFKPAADLGN